MKREVKRTFTYSGKPSVRKRAMSRAKKVGVTLSEVIDNYLAEYADLPVYKTVATGAIVKEHFNDIANGRD